MLKAINALLAIAGGVGGALLLYYLLNLLVERLPGRWEERVKPYVFVAPALLFVTLFLVYPAARTAVASFFDRRGEEFVGWDNYTGLLGESAFRDTLLNNVLWLLVVPAGVVIAGLLVAVLADKLRPRSENFVKSLIFLPMAISFIGAATIWNFIYTFRPPGRPQIGILNAIWTGFGFQPVNWLQISSFRLNTILLTVIMIWLQAGFAMVLLSAAIKGVPEDTLEAARIDGATERQTFFRVVVPQIKSTIFVVYTTIIILVMKIFDIVFVLGGARTDTDVVANRFYNELFQARHWGRAAVMVVVLMVAVIPIMAANIRRFRAEEAIR
jgi:alpha-glucoside transport system permease protein